MGENREYIVVCNRHKALFPGCLLFWGCKTEDEEKRSFDGYTTGIDKCEKYSLNDLIRSNFNFPIYNGENEAEFKKMDDVAVKVDELLNFDWLKSMTVVYRP